MYILEYIFYEQMTPNIHRCLFWRIFAIFISNFSEIFTAHSDRQCWSRFSTGVYGSKTNFLLPFFRYTQYTGRAVTAGILVKFGTTHGRSRSEVGSTKRIDVYGRRGVYRPYLMIWYSQQKIIVFIDILRLKGNFFSLTVC